MSSLLKSDIFFVIASIGVIICTLAFIIAAYYLIQATREARLFIRSARLELEAFRTGRADVVKKVRFVATFIGRFLGNRFR
jgi:hypothetical protein